jgi:hypothetical protein
MTSKTKITLAVALIAAFATPALAQSGYKVKHETSYTAQAPRFIEGRNSAVVGAPGTSNGSMTDRESMVHAN